MQVDVARRNSRKPDRLKVRSGLISRFYALRPEFDQDQHLIDAEPGPGALYPD